MERLNVSPTSCRPMRDRRSGTEIVKLISELVAAGCRVWSKAKACTSESTRRRTFTADLSHRTLEGIS